MGLNITVPLETVDNLVKDELIDVAKFLAKSPDKEDELLVDHMCAVIEYYCNPVEYTAFLSELSDIEIEHS